MSEVKKLSHSLRATLANIGWLSADKIVRMGGSLLVGTLVARYLEPTAFGLLNLAVAIYTLFNTASNLGLDYLVVRDVVLFPEATHEVLGTAFWLKAAASVVTTIFAVVFTASTHPVDHSLIAMVAILSVAAISQAFDVIDFYFQARTLSRLTVIPKLVTFIAINIWRVIAVFHHDGVMTFAVIAAAEILLGELSLFLSYRLFPHRLPPWKLRFSRSKSLLRESWPLILASLLVMIYMRTDQILLGFFVGPKAVGYYSAAVRISEIWYAIPTLVCSSVMPRLLKVFRENKDLYYQRIQIVYNLLFLVSLILAIVTIPSSHFAITLLFGKLYLPAASVLNIHIWTGVFVFLGVLGGQQLIHEGLTMLELWRALGGAVMNLVLNLVLIPKFGIQGSAVATLAAQMTASYFADAFNPKTRHIFRMKTSALSGLWLFRGGYKLNLK
ncbi:MAG TPA: flippase [Acidobacteriaceae bacterium]|jgi:PST family polysaccharide transporter